MKLWNIEYKICIKLFKREKRIKTQEKKKIP